VLPVAAQQNFKITKIEFEGLSRLSPDEVLANTGLKIGEAFSLASLDAAAQRLVDTGLFKNVGYKTRPTKDQITIIFQVEEAKVASSRVVFDNFIWFTNEELIGAVKRELPSFDGTAPDTGNTVDRIIKALQRFLHEQKIEATVTYMPLQEVPNSPVQEHVFTVNGVPLPICTLNFPGAQNITEAKLRESSQELRSSEYSLTFVRSFANRNLIPLYREVGQLKAMFSPPLAKPETTATCKSGVEIAIPVDEGHIYKWNKAEWTGNTALTAQELDPLLGMQAGQPANGRKVDQASRTIQKAYGRKGFLMVKLKSVPEFDEQALSVIFKMDVVEGPQFRMGRLNTRGFSESETNQINAKWELKTGEVYDEGYSDEFLKKHLGEILRDNFQQRAAQGKPAPSIKTEDKPDRKALTVDVTIVLTN
ncbi:MAG TPA: POTRA domain-containing protein, partial [Pyrinomonadaceae bacterium]|nr:POTRA domain-containing protein [Pyrinomonadaceae bacterium]